MQFPATLSCPVSPPSLHSSWIIRSPYSPPHCYLLCHTHKWITVALVRPLLHTPCWDSRSPDFSTTPSLLNANMYARSQRSLWESKYWSLTLILNTSEITRHTRYSLTQDRKVTCCYDGKGKSRLTLGLTTDWSGTHLPPFSPAETLEHSTAIRI